VRIDFINEKSYQNSCGDRYFGINNISGFSRGFLHFPNINALETIWKVFTSIRFYWTLSAWEYGIPVWK